MVVPANRITYRYARNQRYQESGKPECAGGSWPGRGRRQHGSKQDTPPRRTLPRAGVRFSPVLGRIHQPYSSVAPDQATGRTAARLPCFRSTISGVSSPITMTVCRMRQSGTRYWQRWQASYRSSDCPSMSTGVRRLRQTPSSQIPSLCCRHAPARRHPEYQ